MGACWLDAVVSRLRSDASDSIDQLTDQNSDDTTSTRRHQVAPAELEALLLTHPQVADVGVIGVQSAEEKVEVPR